MIEESNTKGRDGKIMKLIMLFYSLPYNKRKVVLEIAKRLSEKKNK